ncbi:MAG: hypothetical protein M1825_002596 [Sarcosagium campestre]|nr:MAG: hypothetical protein M1825_002596 [Sarcosagium campestre]
MGAAGAAIMIGGPALVMYVSPTEEELLAVSLSHRNEPKFTPERRQRVLESKEKNQQEFNEFVGKLKEYSKSNKPIWVLQQQEEKRLRLQAEAEQKRIKEELLARKAMMKSESVGADAPEKVKR